MRRRFSRAAGSLSSSSAMGKASSAPKRSLAPSTPARGPSHTSRSGSRGRTKNDHLARRRRAGRARSRARRTRQVEEVRVLAVLVVDVVVAGEDGRGGEDGDRRRGRGGHRVEEHRAPFREALSEVVFHERYSALRQQGSVPAYRARPLRSVRAAPPSIACMPGLPSGVREGRARRFSSAGRELRESWPPSRERGTIRPCSFTRTDDTIEATTRSWLFTISSPIRAAREVSTPSSWPTTPVSSSLESGAGPRAKNSLPMRLFSPAGSGASPASTKTRALPSFERASTCVR